MKTMLKYLMMLAMMPMLASAAIAQENTQFRAGPVFDEFGLHAPVEGADPIPAHTRFAHAFDVALPAEDGQRNRSIDSAARFINMHASAGVDPANIRVAVVVHGKASLDLLADIAWKRHGREGDNPSGAMIREMLDKGVRIILCGQSSVAHGISQEDVIPGVETALSAMTAHALLQQDGYTVNPF